MMASERDEEAMKILFVGVFDNTKRSTNTSQILCFKMLGHDVMGYNFRQRAAQLGLYERDADILRVVEKNNFDLVVFSKGNGISNNLFAELGKITKTCLWFMDPLVSYNQEMRNKTKLVSYFCCDKKNVLKEALKINKNSFHVCEGYDEEVDKPHNVEQEYDISFIGNVYGDRAKILQSLNKRIKLITNAYGYQHAIEVCKSRINLNICTDNGASDRVYKIMAAGGFLLTDDWEDRENMFVDGKDCVVYNDINDLNQKINFYLQNEELRKQIATNGQKTVQAFNRTNWAKSIIKYGETI
jgi:spore maturation protein CgeB